MRFRARSLEVFSDTYKVLRMFLKILYFLFVPSCLILARQKEMGIPVIVSVHSPVLSSFILLLHLSAYKYNPELKKEM